ncbi:DUF1552 domain-containing protein [Gemmata sp.]|uniref:DUF1552 domain-containing protein n=1 Tax=Gemmata sp. TaxID=1914242 RepID=UPI003F701CA2
MRNRITRRHALRGLGAVVSLPFLECMVPAGARAAAAKPPVRLVWLYAGSGMFMPAFKPAVVGKNWTDAKEFPADTMLSNNVKIAPEVKPLATLDPLLPFKADVSILSGLFHQGAFTRGTVVRHGQDPMCHLTGADLFRVPGIASRNSVSVDRVAARHLGQHTRIPSLALSHDRNMTINYTETGSPVPCDWNPWDVFQRLFSGPTAAEKAQAETRYLQKKSVLDAVVAETKALHGALGAADRERLDEYLTQLREIEERAVQARKWEGVPLPTVPAGVKPLPKVAGVGQTLDLGNPQAAAGNFGPRVRLMLDVLVLALQTDQTRVATAVLGHMGDVYKEEKLNDAYHGYTHGISGPGGQVGMAAVDRLRIGHVAYLLGRMKAVQEADGSTLLDNALVHFGGGMGTWHESTDLANLVAGHGGGQFKMGEHLDCKKAPLAGLYVTMLQAAGVPVKRFADAAAPLGLG